MYVYMWLYIHVYMNVLSCMFVRVYIYMNMNECVRGV